MRFALPPALVSGAAFGLSMAGITLSLVAHAAQFTPPNQQAAAAAAVKPAAAVAAAKPAAKHATIGKAAAFTLKTANDGKAVSLSDFKGKVVLLDFWATWCPPCRAEIPGFVVLQKKYATKGLQIVGVSVDRGGPAVVNAFAKENSINYVSLMSDGEVDKAYGGIRGIPTTFLIDRDGMIVKKYVGGAEMDDFEKEILKLL